MAYGSVRVAGAALCILAGTTAAGAAAQQVAAADAPGVVAQAVAIGPPANAVEDAEPVLPAGSSPNFVPPAHDAAGYLTPNRGLSGEEKTWHVRVALNVAALGCRGPEAAEMVGGYNALLTNGKAMLAAVATAMGVRYKARFGTAWQARHDDAMTRLYNFWALPPAQARFCAAALGVLREAAAVDPALFPVFASAVLPRLEAPIIAFFEEYDRYRVAHEAWRTRRARAMIAAAVPAAPLPMATAAAALTAQAVLQPGALPLPTAPVAPSRPGTGEP